MSPTARATSKLPILHPEIKKCDTCIMNRFYGKVIEKVEKVRRRRGIRTWTRRSVLVFSNSLMASTWWVWSSESSDLKFASPSSRMFSCSRKAGTVPAIDHNKVGYTCDSKTNYNISCPLNVITGNFTYAYCDTITQFQTFKNHRLLLSFHHRFMWST